MELCNVTVLERIEMWYEILSNLSIDTYLVRIVLKSRQEIGKIFKLMHVFCYRTMFGQNTNNIETNYYRTERNLTNNMYAAGNVTRFIFYLNGLLRFT